MDLGYEPLQLIAGGLWVSLQFECYENVGNDKHLSDAYGNGCADRTNLFSAN
ncbi:hypothetical protein GS682_03615 [Nostoc sp. B(2019)]|nr:hypothetical protein [Nostoc sp. B(2019)]